MTKYLDAAEYGQKVDKIADESVYYYQGQFFVKKDGVELSAKTMDALISKLKQVDKPTSKVIEFYAGVYGGYEDQLKVFDAVAYSKSVVFSVIEENGKPKKLRVQASHLYAHTSELENKMIALLQRIKDLRHDIEEVESEAAKFP